MAANNAGAAPPVVEVKYFCFKVGAGQALPFTLLPLGGMTNHAPKVTAVGNDVPVPVDALILGVYIEGLYHDARHIDPVTFRSLLLSSAVHRTVKYQTVETSPPPAGADAAGIMAHQQEVIAKLTEALTSASDGNTPTTPAFRPSHQLYLARLQRMVFGNSATPNDLGILGGLPRLNPVNCPSPMSDIQCQQMISRHMRSSTDISHDLFMRY